MTEQIRLPWAEKIRARVEEYKGQVTNIEANILSEFIKPILDFAEAEEKRITEEFELRKQ